MERERRVRLKYPENDSFIELWQEVESPRKFVGRYTGGLGEWVKICDPLGYCEMDYSFGPDEVFIVCDKKGNELFRSRNGDGSAHFNTYEKEAHEQFAKYAEEAGLKTKVEDVHAMFLAHYISGNPVGGLNEWLMSYQDPDLYPQADDYPENWTQFDIDTVGEPEVLKTYTYLGETWKIERVHYKHRYCGVEWSSLFSGEYYIGDEFDTTTHGTMYCKRQAAGLLTVAIKANHPNRYSVSVVKKLEPYGSSDPYYKERRYKIERAWEYLADGDLHRKHIDKALQEEKAKSHFFGSYEEIQKVYPECVRDWSYTP